MINLASENVEVTNREIIPSNVGSTNTFVFNHEVGAGLAVLREVDFAAGTIELDLKGENNPGKSFIGIAFNI